MSKFDKLFEIPEEVANNVPKITILNFDRMLIENYKCILEYQEFFIRVKMTNGILDINGFNLELNEMTKDDLIVTGIIDSIDFEKFKEEGTINEKNKNRNVQKWTNKQKSNINKKQINKKQISKKQKNE